MNDVYEKMSETLQALTSLPYILAGALTLRDGMLLNYQISANGRSPSDLLNLMYYGASIAIEKARAGSIDEVVITNDRDKIVVSWIIPTAMIVVIAKQEVETDLILSDIQGITSDAAMILIESDEATTVRKIPAANKNRIGSIQVSVKETCGTPLEGCRVEVYIDRKRVQNDITTKSGIASFKLITGEYRLVVTRDGYEKFNEKILMDREFITQSVTLKLQGGNRMGNNDS